MSYETISPNMNLLVPSVGLTSGPQYASDLNQSLNTIDMHNHTVGLGVPVPTSGLNINADLPLNSFSLTLVNTVRCNSLSASLANISPNVGAIYVYGNELYYNDWSGGHQVQITNNGSVNAATGSITGLSSPASVNFSGSTFVFQSNTSTAAAIDVGNIIVRSTNASLNAYGVTLQVPASITSSWPLVLPALPASTALLQLDSSGNITASVPQTQALSPTGVILPYGGVSAPSGWLVCDGSAVSRTTYGALFGIIGTSFGVGDGSTTFNVPNLINSAPFGIGSRFSMGQTGGYLDPSLNTLFNHGHVATNVISDLGHNHSAGTGSQSVGNGHFAYSTGATEVGYTNSSTTGITVNTTISYTGNSTTNGNMPPFVGVNYIIKT